MLWKPVNSGEKRLLSWGKHFPVVNEQFKLGRDEVWFDLAQVDPHFNLQFCKLCDFINRRGELSPRF